MRILNSILTGIIFFGAAAGIFLDNYLGGLITGFCVCMLLFVTIGRRQADKAANRIDKKISDIIIHHQQKMKEYGSETD